MRVFIATFLQKLKLKKKEKISCSWIPRNQIIFQFIFEVDFYTSKRHFQWKVRTSTKFEPPLSSRCARDEVELSGGCTVIQFLFQCQPLPLSKDQPCLMTDPGLTSYFGCHKTRRGGLRRLIPRWRPVNTYTNGPIQWPSDSSRRAAWASA